MTTQTRPTKRPRLTPEQRAARTNDAITHIDQAIGSITDAPAYRDLLRAMARLSHYSLNYQILIWSQRADANAVAGFHTWLAAGRAVRKGETGIAILKPITAKQGDDDDSRQIVGFGIAHVFDISQTQPLPGEEETQHQLARALHCPRLDGEDGGLAQQLIAAAPRRGVTITQTATLEGELMGFYEPSAHRVTVRQDVSGLQLAKTIAHELGHHLHHALADAAQCDRETREAVAEATAFIVLDAAVLDASSRSVPYIAGWTKDRDLFRSALDSVRICANALITALEDQEG